MGSILCRSYVSPAGLTHMQTHKYNAMDRSLFNKYILQPFYDRLILIVPRWLAPNVITLMGISLVVLHSTLLAHYAPDFTGAVPRWLYFLSALCVAGYTTLDNLDGKQARRTGTGSPLGEVLDHGLDSMAGCLVTLSVATTFQLGTTVSTCIAFFTTVVPFFMSVWEEYHTKLFYLGYINGPAEGVWLIAFFHILAGIAGPEIYTQKAFGYTVGNVILFGFIIPGAVITMWGNVYNVFKKIDEESYQALPTHTDESEMEDDITVVNNDQLDGPGAAQSLQTRRYRKLSALRLVLPLIIITILSAMYLYIDFNLFVSYPRLVMLALSLVYSLLVTKLLVCYVCNEPYPIWHTSYGLLLLVGILIGGHVIGLEVQYYYLIAFITIMSVFFLHYWICIIRQFTSHLGIRFLSIPSAGPAVSMGGATSV